MSVQDNCEHSWVHGSLECGRGCGAIREEATIVTLSRGQKPDLGKAIADGSFVGTLNEVTEVTHLPRGRKVDVGDGGLDDLLTGVMEEFGAHNIDPARPFTGQVHTDQGERGQQEVHGIRMRDICDCLAIALVHCTGLNAPEGFDDKIESLELTYNDLYQLDLHDVDPVAIIQGLTCEIEKRMGIYPNIPDSPYKDKE